MYLSKFLALLASATRAVIAVATTTHLRSLNLVAEHSERQLQRSLERADDAMSVLDRAQANVHNCEAAAANQYNATNATKAACRAEAHDLRPRSI